MCLKIAAIRMNAEQCSASLELKEKRPLIKQQRGFLYQRQIFTAFAFFGRFHSIKFCDSISKLFFTLFFNFLFVQGNGTKGNQSIKCSMILHMLWKLFSNLLKINRKEKHALRFRITNEMLMLISVSWEDCIFN